MSDSHYPYTISTSPPADEQTRRRLKEAAAYVDQWLERRHEAEEAAARRMRRVVWFAWWKANGPTYLFWAVGVALAAAYWLLAFWPLWL